MSVARPAAYGAAGPVPPATAAAASTAAAPPGSAGPTGRQRRWLARPRTLRRRLVVVLVTVVLVMAAVLTVASSLALRSQLMGRLDQELTQAADRLHQAPPHGMNQPGTDPGTGTNPGNGTDGSTSTEQQLGPWLGQNAGTLVVTTLNGTPRAGYLDQNNEFQTLTSKQQAELEAVPADGEPHDVSVAGLGSYRAISTTNDAGEPATIAMPTKAVSDTVSRYVGVDATLGVLAVLVAGLVGALLVRRSLRPLNEVAAAASRVSELELSRGEPGEIPRVDPAITDERTEVGQVGSALNRMLENVETSLAARHASEMQVRQFVADASHELRTPLASIRGYAELVRRSPDVVPPDTERALGRIESESGRMGALVEDLLLLARLDAGRPLEREPVDLTVLAVDALTDAYAAGPDHRWELALPRDDGAARGDAGLDEGVGDEHHDADSAGEDAIVEDALDDREDPGADEGDEPVDLVVTGDEARLRQVLTNLLANARVHTPAGTRVVLGLRVEDGSVVVTVRDDGPGIPADERPRLFQRFTRGDQARNRTGGSTGLGLAIAQGIVAAHGGTIEVESATADEGGPTGTTFTVRLPEAASAAE